MKKVYYLVIALMSFVFITNTSAQSIYYINEKGVTFTEEEYNFLTYMFWEGSQDLMSPEDYTRFITSDIMHGELEKETITIGNDGIMPIDNTKEDNRANTLSIGRSCTTDCFVSITLNWKGIPTISKYDVIGALLVNSSLTNTPSTTVTYNTTTKSYNNNMQKFTKGVNGSLYNGFGVSVELPTSGSNLIVNTLFRATAGGHVYGSYQHAMESISLANSKKYTLSLAGEGGVFDFYGVAYDIYDRSPGVDISL